MCHFLPKFLSILHKTVPGDLESAISVAIDTQDLACQTLIFLKNGLENAYRYREICEISAFSVEFEEIWRIGWIAADFVVLLANV
jgi:hypothetical protein